MHDEQGGHNAALAELRERLKAGMTRMRLNQTDLAGRAGLGRTTVSEALSAKKPVPSAQTVEALARALKLPVQDLLDLQRQTSAATDATSTRGPGRPIGEWQPHDLEVHPAGPGRSSSGMNTSATRSLPGYVYRKHDQELANAVQEAAAGRSQIVILVGTSSTGKTRACWEAVQLLAKQGWLLWHPFDPTRAEAALEDLHRVQPRTVVWLNEAQHYLGDQTAGERIAAAIHHLLVSPERGPILVLGTLWPEYVHQYMFLPMPGEEDPYSRVRELFSGRTVEVPDSFDPEALATATALAKGGDRLLQDALTRARTDGRVTQDLAGAPELLSRYQHASPAARALLETAMDARRLGVGLYLPQAFLIAAASDYLTDINYDGLTDDWAEAAFAELARPVHGKQAPLRRTNPRPSRRPPTLTADSNPEVSTPMGLQFRLADYLEQYGRDTRRCLCPPASFWHAAHAYLTDSGDLNNLAEAAKDRHRLQWAHHLRHRASNHGSTVALHRLQGIWGENGDQRNPLTVHLQTIVSDIDTGRDMTGVWGKSEDWKKAEAPNREVVDYDALYRSVVLREEAGDRKGAEFIARCAAERGNIGALRRLAELREKTGDWEGVEALARQAADYGNTDLLRQLAVTRDKAGEHKEAENLARQAISYGDSHALYLLASLRRAAGDREKAENLARQAAIHGNARALYLLIGLREDAGDKKDAETLARQAMNEGKPGGMYLLAGLREESGDREGAEILAREAADNGHTGTLRQLAVMREQAGDMEGAEVLAREAAAHGHAGALHQLAVMREKAGGRRSTERPARWAADYGSKTALKGIFESLWPNGLDPDGTPTLPWQP